MRVLTLHNYYKEKGGEDSVFRSETELLKNKGNTVETLVWKNSDISSLPGKVKTGVLSFFNPFSLGMIKRKVREFKPDIIHVHNFFPRISPSVFFIPGEINIPVIMTVHNFRLICSNGLLYTKGDVCEKCVNKVFPLSGVLRRCYRDSFLQTANVTALTSLHKLRGTWKKRVDGFIALTDFQREKLLDSSLKLNKEKVFVKPNFVKDPGPGAKKRDDYFLFVGRLTEEKGIRTLLEAQNYFHFRLKIIGDGSLRELVEKEVGKNDNLNYLGFRDHEYIIKSMKSARALILPSLCYEGFPVVIAEALSTGTPVISSDIGGQAVIVKDGYSGLHFRVSDSKDLAEKIRVFKKGSFESMYENARKSYIHNFTPEKNYKELIGIYKKVINEKKKNNIS